MAEFIIVGAVSSFMFLAIVVFSVKKDYKIIELKKELAKEKGFPFPIVDIDADKEFDEALKNNLK